MLCTAMLFWLCSAHDPQHAVGKSVRFADQLKVMADRPECGATASITRWCLSGYVGLALWMTQYYVGEYGFDIKLAAFLAACFRCLAACCARWAAGCRTSLVPTRPPGG